MCSAPIYFSAFSCNLVSTDLKTAESNYQRTENAWEVYDSAHAHPGKAGCDFRVFTKPTPHDHYILFGNKAH